MVSGDEALSPAGVVYQALLDALAARRAAGLPDDAAEEALLDALDAAWQALGV